MLTSTSSPGGVRSSPQLLLASPLPFVSHKFGCPLPALCHRPRDDCTVGGDPAQPRVCSSGRLAHPGGGGSAKKGAEPAEQEDPSIMWLWFFI